MSTYFPTQICPVGVPGILYIAGRGVAKGYLGDWHKTRYTFLDNFFGDGTIYCTGESSVCHYSSCTLIASIIHAVYSIKTDPLCM